MSQLRPTAARRYLDAAKELNKICDSAFRTPAESELHTMILKAGSALKELIACLERLDEEMWGKSHTRDLRPPQPLRSPDTIMALDTYRDYERAPHPDKCTAVFKIVNGTVVDLYGLCAVKRRILWEEGGGQVGGSSGGTPIPF